MSSCLSLDRIDLTFSFIEDSAIHLYIYDTEASSTAGAQRFSKHEVSFEAIFPSKANFLSEISNFPTVSYCQYLYHLKSLIRTVQIFGGFIRRADKCVKSSVLCRGK